MRALVLEGGAMRGIFTAGVLDATVNVASGQAHIIYVPGSATMASLRSAIESTGYQAEKLPAQLF